MRRIVFVVFDRFQPLDLIGPHEVFQCAGRLSGECACEVAAAAGPVRSRDGLAVHAGHGVDDLEAVRRALAAGPSTDTSGVSPSDHRNRFRSVQEYA